MGKSIDDIIGEKLAMDVVKTLTPEQVNEVLAKGLAEVLEGWKIKGVVEEAVTTMATTEIHNYLSRPEVRERINIQAVVACENFISELTPALLQVMLTAFTESSAYGRNDGALGKAIRLHLGLREQTK